jgi:hypothetical protein
MAFELQSPAPKGDIPMPHKIPHILTATVFALSLPALAQSPVEKDSLAPHTIMISAALRGSLDAAKGLEAQLTTVSDPSAKESMKHVKTYEKGIKAALSQAAMHAKELQGAAKKFPDIANSKELRETSAALTNAENTWQSLRGKFNNPSYVKNASQAKMDLNSFEKTLDQAISKTSSLNDRLNIKTIG